MPSIGRFLELLEAVSRRDSASVTGVIKAIADEERKLKHYSAAHQLLKAAEVAVSASGYDQEAVLAYAAAPPPPLDVLQRLDVDDVRAPVLADELTRDLGDFIDEWRAEARLRAAHVAPRQFVLLHGPPGCGKTLIARHLAFVLRLPLYLVRFDALISSYLGETASNLQKVFAYIATNRCALLIDEIDAIAKLRDDRNELGELKRVVISLLQNLDHTRSQSLLIATTNHPHLLDPALWRRFDVVWEVGPPTLAARQAIIDREVAGSSAAAKLVAELTEGLSGADLDRIGQDARRRTVVKPDSGLEQNLVVSALDVLRRAKDRLEDTEARRTRLALFLRTTQKYSYTQLEQISGVPRSTLHHRGRREAADGR